jgi:hypothetical protein
LKRAVAVVIALAVTFCGAQPAAAGDHGPREALYSYSLLGEVELIGREGTVPLPRALERVADVTYSWTSKDRKRVYLRPAPLTKIETKHNLTMNVVKTVTKRASSILRAGSGTNFSYYLMAYEVTCYLWGCRVTNSVNVRVLVDYREYGSQTYGVVTAYCEGISGRCPNFVKNALNV